MEKFESKDGVICSRYNLLNLFFPRKVHRMKKPGLPQSLSLVKRYHGVLLDG